MRKAIVNFFFEILSKRFFVLTFTIYNISQSQECAVGNSVDLEKWPSKRGFIFCEAFEFIWGSAFEKD
jgi:hypothetical protein